MYTLRGLHDDRNELLLFVRCKIGLEQTMSDLIRREDVMALAKDICVPHKDGYVHKHRCVDALDVMELPSAEHKRKSGKWVKNKTESVLWYCSECDYGYYESTLIADTLYNFCPNCGADMRGERGTE